VKGFSPCLRKKGRVMLLHYENLNNDCSLNLLTLWVGIPEYEITKSCLDFHGFSMQTNFMVQNITGKEMIMPPAIVMMMVMILKMLWLRK